MSGGRLLVTGFGPFPGVPRNPSGRLALRVAALGRRSLGSPAALVLRTAYDAIPQMLEPALAEGPAAVLMIGVAARAQRVRVEARALNRASRLFPDASGRIAGGLALEGRGPAARRSPMAAQALACLRRRGIPAAPSQDAGRYLCNAAYYRALRDGCPVLFLHIPLARGSGRPCRPGAPKRLIRSDKLAEAVVAVAGALLRQARVKARKESGRIRVPRQRSA